MELKEHKIQTIQTSPPPRISGIASAWTGCGKLQTNKQWKREGKCKRLKQTSIPIRYMPEWSQAWRQGPQMQTRTEMKKTSKRETHHYKFYRGFDRFHFLEKHMFLPERLLTETLNSFEPTPFVDLAPQIERGDIGTEQTEQSERSAICQRSSVYKNQPIPIWNPLLLSNAIKEGGNQPYENPTHTVRWPSSCS